MSLEEYGQLNGLLGMSVLSCILPKLIFTITERIIARWLVESYGLWEFRPWKWRKWSRSAGCFVFGFSPKKINVIEKQIHHNFPWSTLL